MKKMKDNNVYFKQELIDSHSCSELDFILQDFIGFNYKNDDDYVDITPQYGTAEGYPIAIDYIISKLEKMKEQGATHVSLEHHIDHIGYNIDGWKISKATQGEIDSYLGKKNEIKQKNRERRKEELKRQLRQLEENENKTSKKDTEKI